MNKLAALLLMCIIFGYFFAYDTPVATNANKGHMVSEVYVVHQGDTLDGIAYQFMNKSSVKRDVREFRSGIEENNYELLKGRQKGIILEGDKLVIKYWIKN